MPDKFKLKRNQIKKGGITVFLCLIFAAIIPLIFACISSARISAGRAAVSAAAEEGLFSLFSNYDKTLYEKYGLLFLDGGFDSEELKIGNLAMESMSYTNKVLSPLLKTGGTTPENLYRISIDSLEITGYVLATDSSFAALTDQICDVMKLKLGTDVIESLVSDLGTNSAAVSEFGTENEDEIDSLAERYESQKELAESLKTEIENDTDSSDQTTSEETSNVEVPEDYQNPLDNILKLKKMGIMAFALPNGTVLSDTSIDADTLLSSRTLNKGMGILPEKDSGVTEKVLVSEFAIDSFSNYLNCGGGEALQYQAEYIIGGKISDAQNLKAVMNKLLLTRLGLNYIYLLSSTEKAAQIYETAAIISTILLMPEGTEAVAQIVRALWAYAESMMDVKSLLSGNKVPVFKDDSSWQVSLSLFSSMDSKTHSVSGKGLTYSEYLRVLMYLMPEETLTERIADMIEHNRRIADGTEEFCLDTCLSTLEIDLIGSMGGREISVIRSYGYTQQ